MSEDRQGMNQAALRRLLATEEVQALLRPAAPGAPPASPEALEQALGPATLERLEQASGMGRQALLGTLAALLPVLAARASAGASQAAPEIPNHPGPGFGYGGTPPGRERDPPKA